MNRRARGDAGELITRRNRVTRTLVTVYRAADQGLEEDGYAAVCQTHGNLICTTTRALAFSAAEGLNVLDWCTPCRCVRDGGHQMAFDQCQECGTHADDVAARGETIVDKSAV